MDIEVDEINKRSINAVMIFGKTRSIILYLILSIIGLSYGLWLSLNLNLLALWSIHLISFLCLWLYSLFLKTMPFAGNLIIAAFCALIPLMPLLFEFGFYEIQLIPSYFIFVFLALFAFLITLIREMIKDMQDIEGDRQTGMYTLPVLFGIHLSKWITSLFNFLLISLMFSWVYFFLGNDWTSVTYLTIGILFPLLFLNYKLIHANNSIEFYTISKNLKGIIMVGLLYPILYFFLQL